MRFKVDSVLNKFALHLVFLLSLVLLQIPLAEANQNGEDLVATLREAINPQSGSCQRLPYPWQTNHCSAYAEALSSRKCGNLRGGNSSEICQSLLDALSPKGCQGDDISSETVSFCKSIETIKKNQDCDSAILAEDTENNEDYRYFCKEVKSKLWGSLISRYNPASTSTSGELPKKLKIELKNAALIRGAGRPGFKADNFNIDDLDISARRILASVAMATTRLGHTLETPSSCLDLTSKGYTTKEMDSSYEGEKIPYLRSPDERSQFMVSIKDGKIYKYESDELLNKVDVPYVMDKNGELYVGNEFMNHSSFLAGGAVLGAGEITIEKGVIKKINRDSGHYQPAESHLLQVLSVLTHKGYKFDPSIHIGAY